MGASVSVRTQRTSFSSDESEEYDSISVMERVEAAFEPKARRSTTDGRTASAVCPVEKFRAHTRAQSPKPVAGVPAAPRPTWDDHFMNYAELVARRSSCPKLAVGCVLVQDRHAISSGYNGYLPGTAHQSMEENGHQIATAHAEQNAVSWCARRGISCEGATAYVTHYPCLHCFKTLQTAGVRRIYYLNDYHNHPGVTELNALMDQPVQLCKFETNAP